MQTVPLSLTVAFLVCVLVLVVFWLFTLTPLARRIISRADRRYTPRMH